MKYINKYKAFTLAEVMILMLTLAVLMAAFAPIMTKRERNVSFDDVWTYVQSDDSNDAYFDVSNKSYTAQAFIGVPAKKALDVATGSSNLYSKLVIRSANELKNGNTQGQMQFRAGNSANGDLLGTLFAGRGNMLVGGNYFSVKTDDSESGSTNARRNTAFGRGALTALTSGQDNTAIGYSALSNITTGKANTAVGFVAGYNLESGKIGNTFVGPRAGYQVTRGEYNTIIGTPVVLDSEAETAPYKDFNKASYNTLVGGYSDNITTGYGNTAVGYGALNSLTTGYYNTSIGGSTFKNLSTGSYNTAVGYNAGDFMTDGSYKTFVGAFSGSMTQKDSKNLVDYYPDKRLYESTGSNEYERVFIGSLPRNSVVGSSSSLDTGKGPGAVLEVHNINKKDTSYNTLPIQGLGYSSVVINGNLIVRGQSYFETVIWRPATFDYSTYQANPKYLPKGLVAYRLLSTGTANGFMGFDGARRENRSFARCNRRRCQLHDYDDLRQNCICTIGGTSDTTSYNTNYTTWIGSSVKGCSTSYDWLSPSTGWITNGDDGDGDGSICAGGKETDVYQNHPMGFSYKDQATEGTVQLERNSEWKAKNSKNSFDYYLGNKSAGVERGSHAALGTDFPLAHLRGSDKKAHERYFGKDVYLYSSCCPNLTDGASEERVGKGGVKTSDARLKNIGEKFTAGLPELKRLSIYNFTFINDANKTPQVGVMAQDLKRVFPNAVTKDENGYYQIRWDEMLYAVINSVKDLNSRIEKLASNIGDYKSRVAALKKDNQELNAKLDKLEAELTVLETKKH
ncbi:MAG: tail fiber domain-containing protein [Muribaculaceae bacterium]|nr:tail fiber domain-containing protein [Muribaculaceae bacterium]